MPRRPPSPTSGSSPLARHVLIRAGSVLLALSLLLSLGNASALASRLDPAHSDLVCFSTWDSIPPASHHLVQSGKPLYVDVAISSRMGGVGVELWLGYRPFSTNTVINVLEGRSAAGAGWQYSSFTTTYQGLTVFTNQAAGNRRGYQWGFTTTYDVNKTSTLSATNWAPLFSDALGQVSTSPCEAFDSTSNPYVEFDLGQMKLLAERRRTESGYAIALRDAYTLRSLVNQYWQAYLPVHALYLSRSVARAHDLRLYLVSPAWVEGPVQPYQEGLSIQHAALAYDSANNPTWTIDQSATYAVFVWGIAGQDAGLAIPLDNGANLSLEQTVYCTDPQNDTCGSIRWLTAQPVVYNASFPQGSTRTYEFAYYIGTPAQLTELGYPIP